ncbi:MAG: PspC domain-containing protein [Actinomycetes bacterium]
MTQQASSPGTSGAGQTEQEPRSTSGLDSFFDSLRRSPVARSDDRWAGGVCAGLAERLCVDPVLVRVFVAVVAFLGGVPAVLYGIAWLGLPDRRGRIEAEAAVRGEVSPGAVVAVLFVLLGGFLPRPWQWWWPGADGGWGSNLVGALVVVAVVVALMAFLPRWSGGTSRGDGDAAGAASPTGAGRGSGAAVRVRAPRRPARRGPGAVATSAVLGLALLAAGGAALEVQQGGLDLPMRLAAALSGAAVCGLAMVWLGVVGRTDGAVGVLGVTAAGLALWFALVPSAAHVGGGDSAWAPRSEQVALDGYVNVVGDGAVDLTAIRPARGDVVVPVRLGIGSLHVVVPGDVPVTVRSRTLVGASDLPSQLPAGWTTRGRHAGFGADVTSSSGSDVGPRLVVDAQGLIGNIDVEVANR